MKIDPRDEWMAEARTLRDKALREYDEMKLSLKDAHEEIARLIGVNAVLAAESEKAARKIADVLLEKSATLDQCGRLILAVEHLSTLAIPLERLTRRLES